MSANSGPRVSRNSLATYFDLSNQLCFRGEPTTNSVRVYSDFSGTAYAPTDEYAGATIRKQYDATVKTPVGYGATLIMESGGTGWQTLSRFGGGGSGNFSLSFYIKPITNDLTTVSLGLLGDGSQAITFNLNTRAITYGNTDIPRVAFMEDVRGYPGWLRIGANLWGRSGGWVGSFGYNTGAQYAGSDGAKQIYVAGAQYETTYAPTNPLPALATRGTTVQTGGGLIDMSLNGNSGEFVNGPSFNKLTNNNWSISFDGTNDYILLNRTITFGNGNWTVIMWANSNAAGNISLLSNLSGGPVSNSFGFNGYKISYNNYDANPGWKTTNGNTTLSTGVWYMLAWVNYAGVSASSGTMKMFVNGIADSAVFNSYTTNGGPCNTIGNRYGSYFNGKIASFQHYTTAFTDDEILRNFNAFRGRFRV